MRWRWPFVTRRRYEKVLDAREYGNRQYEWALTQADKEKRRRQELEQGLRELLRGDQP